MTDEPAMGPGEANAIATSFSVAALMRHLIARGILKPDDVGEIMRSARAQIVGSGAAGAHGEFALRSILSCTHAIQELAGVHPPATDVLGR